MFLTPARAEQPTHVEYPGLPLQSGQIRLIKLLPGEWYEPLRIQLFSVLHDTAEYQTLSYVWGSRNVTRTIFVNNRPYPSTINLESALRHLRERHQDGIVLWVDALCINQDDTEERTRQVQLMGDIYKMCKKVIVYLGDRLDGTNRVDEPPPAVVNFGQLPTPENLPGVLENRTEIRRDADVVDVFRLLQELSMNIHLNEVSGLRLDTLGKEIAQTKVKMNENSDEQRREKCLARIQLWQEQQRQRTYLIERLRKLMHPPFTPWWNRIWVIQEVVAPPLIDIVYGACSASWNMLTLAAWSQTRHSTHCCVNVYARLPRDLRKVLEDFSQRVTGIDELRTAQDAFNRRVREPKPIRDRKASDPRDKVYALLSLVKPEQESFALPMLPDYALSESEVFAQATLQCIYTSKSLSVFSTELGRKFRSDLPSWVPDWGAPGGYTYTVRARTVELYNACPSDKSIEKSVQLSGTSRLMVRGFEFDKVQSLGDTMWGDEASFCRDTLANWWQHIFHENTSVDSAERKVFQDFWALMCGDVICKPQADGVVRRAVARDELHFVTWSLDSLRSPFYDMPENVYNALGSNQAKAYRSLLLLWPQLAVSPFKRFTRSPKEYLPQWKWKGRYEVIHERTLNELTMIQRLLSAVHPYERFGILDLLDDAGHFREDAPWKELYDDVTKELSERYGLDDPSELHSTEDDVSMIDDSVMAATLSRRLIVGEHHVGLGPANTMVGDELCFLEGGKTPFVLRKRDGGDRNEYDQIEYEVVGDCYLQDMMDDGPAQLTRRWRVMTLV